MHYKINHVAVWLLVVVQVGLGALWYSPLAFGSEWMNLLRLTAADIDQSDPIPFVIAIAGTVALTYFLAWLFLQLEVTYLSEAFKIAFLLWFCIAFTEHATHYSFQGVHYGVLLIDMGKTLTGMLIAAVVLASWRRRAS